MRTVEAFAGLNDAGKFHWQTLFKSGGPSAFGVGRWADFSMGAGTPKYNAYVGSQATATPLIGAGNDGIFTGGGAQEKILYQWGLQSFGALTNASFAACDYVMHYPLIDGDDTDVQVMDNAAVLPRYGMGEGLQIMAVCTTPMAADATCEVSYTNSNGVPGRVTQFRLLSTTVVGCIISSAGVAGGPVPFVPLQSGDRGVLRIDEVRNLTGAGGFFVLVLVKPLSWRSYLEAGAAVEHADYPSFGRVPGLPAGHYINLIGTSALSGSAFPLQAWFEFNWE